MSKPDGDSGGFWRTLPGVVTAIAGLITAVTGLVLAANQVGMLGGDGGQATPPARSVSAPGLAPASAPQTGAGELPDVQVTADRIAGKWVGEATRGPGQTFVLRLSVAKGCVRNARCRSMSVSDIPCKGEVFLKEVNEGTVELSVDNFTPGSSASCRPTDGEYFTPQRNGTLRYRTGHDGSLAATLSRAPG